VGWFLPSFIGLQTPALGKRSTSASSNWSFGLSRLTLTLAAPEAHPVGIATVPHFTSHLAGLEEPGIAARAIDAHQREAPHGIAKGPDCPCHVPRREP
jgi:hypothetical protein